MSLRLQDVLKEKPLARYSRRASLAVVGICIFLISFMTVTRLLFTEEVVATNTLRAMAQIYYEDYYYEKFVADRSGVDLSVAFEPYRQTGFRTVTLRQLLTFDNGRLAAEESDFASCDKAGTTIRITPEPPYTTTDYYLETTLVCNTE